MGIVDIEIRLLGSQKDSDIKKIMQEINRTVFLLKGYNVIHTKVKRSWIERIVRKLNR